MRKFMFLFVLCGLMSGQAWGDNGIFRLTNGNTYVCGNEDGTFNFADGNKVQTLGPSWLDNDSRPSHRYYTCSRSPWNPAYDDHWNSSDPNWCSNTELKDVNMANTKICIYVAGQQKECYPQIAGRTDGCLHIRCADGYKLSGGKCVEESKGCPYMGQTVAIGWSTDNADLGECKKRYTSDNWKNVEKVISCSARCDASGVIIFTRTACAAGWKNGSVETKKVCIEDTNGGDNGSTTKCSAGSSKDITSQKNCGKGQTFECTDMEKGNCICGKCKDASVPPAESSLERCLKGRTSAEGQACCYLPASVAKWENNKCVCLTPNMEFKIGPNGRGQCNAKPVAPGATFNCEPAVMGILETWLMQCATKADIVSMITQIKTLCTSPSRTADNFNTLYSTLLALNPGDCATVVQQVQPVVPIDDTAEKLRKSRRNISDAHAILVGMRETFKASVWKDEEGKFNTSRLVSDSIAGVVLGTVGGVVTSSVVKKNQVENGFEDIKCTVGGQTVADWGDEFRVGIQ